MTASSTNKDLLAWTTQIVSAQVRNSAVPATDLAGFKARWQAQGVPFTERMLPDKYQCGLVDPDGITVNLNFPPAEAS